MSWLVVFLLTLFTACFAINRPVYKIVLTQKGYTQFLQYDVDTPPLREFTFCTWIRVYDLECDQSIFSYVVNGNKRLLRLWLDSGGRFLKFSINDKVTSNTPLNLTKDVWRHVCLSFQSDFGAWALYVDSKLLTCQSAQNLYGFVLPGGGSVILGYGTADSGAPSGFEGEIFGANMLLVSTIERNLSTTYNSRYLQTPFEKNKVKNKKKQVEYVILSDLQTDEIHNNYEKLSTPSFMHRNKSHIRYKTPYSLIDHDVGLNFGISNQNATETSREILDFPEADRIQTTSEKNKINFWNLVNTAGREGKFKVNKNAKSSNEQFNSGTKDILKISDYETPPPPPEPPAPKSLYNIEQDLNGHTKMYLNQKITDLSDVETPPPIQKDTKVYGQWTSSKFAGSVLNYLKSINFHNRDKKPPASISFTKMSDNYPYASEFKISKLRPPVKFQRRNFVDGKTRIYKRGINPSPEINVQILEEDIRSTILKTHAETRPRNVEVTNRGVTTKIKDHRFYRNVENHDLSEENLDSTESTYESKPFYNKSKGKNETKIISDLELYKSNNLITILPFLKSLEYLAEDTKDMGSEHKVRNSDMYTKSLSNGNKWHNVKSYNNDFTPRRINMEIGEGITDLDHKIAEANKKHPSVRLKYQHESNKFIHPKDDDARIAKGRELAMGVSNQSNTNHDSISIIKYNHGYLPSHNKKTENNEKMKSEKSNTKTGKNNFNKQVKLGNALNERHVIGVDDEQKKKSFVGGDEDVPDINKYRSDIDNENTKVPSSLGPRVCENTQMYSRKLYIHQDESIIASHIESPVRKKNAGIEFINQNYNKCSLEESNFESSNLLFINWSKTPVRLFGGAFPKKTTDLCGFF